MKNTMALSAIQWKNTSTQKALLILLMLYCLKSATAQNVGRTELGYCAISNQGEKISGEYDFIQFNENGFQLAALNGKWGYLNRDGSIAIPLEFDIAYPFNGEFALVGEAGKYYYITKAHQVLDSIEWPQAPRVYTNQFLVTQSDKARVLYSDGSELFRSNYLLALGSKAGIIEYKSDKDSVYQYASHYGYKELKRIRAYVAVAEPVITQQGYLCLRQNIDGKDSYSVYDELGNLIVQCDPEGVEPTQIQLIWKDFVYVPTGSIYPEHSPLGAEMHFQMNELWLRGQNYKSSFSFQLCNKYEGDKMILLKDADKWISFNGRNVEGHYLFDEVLPGDEYLTPVRIAQKWYLLDRREDSLIGLPYKDIHPIGMNRGRFFGSMREGGGMQEAKWAFVSYYSKSLSEEQYEVPLLPEDYSGYDQKIRYRWSNQLNEALRENRRVLLNNRAEEVWMDSESTAIAIEDFFKVKFAFAFDHFKELPKKHPFKKNELSVLIEPIASGVYVQMMNTKKTEEPVEIQDGYFQAVLEMKTKEGQWKRIGYLDPSWCGNSYYGAYFPAKKYTSTLIPLPKGEESITLRVVVNPNYENRLVSNEITTKTNGARLWVEKYCGGFGCETVD